MADHVQITGIPPRIQYVANGSQTSFEYPFALFKSENMKVYLNDILQDSTTYTVSGAGTTGGGTVMFTTAPTQNTIVTLVRVLDIERTTDFQEGGALRASALNYELDYQIACQQQIADNLNRSMVLPPYAADINVNLTLPIPDAGKAIVWNADGTNLENSRLCVNEIADTMTEQVATATEKAATATAAAQTATEKATIATEKATEAVTTIDAKMNTSMNNITATWGMPSSTEYIELTYTNNEVYTAPANGYFCAISNNNGITSNYRSALVTSYGAQIAIISGSYDYGGVVIPVAQGQTVTAKCEVNRANVDFRFVYAEGEI